MYPVDLPNSVPTGWQARGLLSGWVLAEWVFVQGVFWQRGFLSKGFFWQRGFLAEGGFGEGFLERGVLFFFGEGGGWKGGFWKGGICPRGYNYRGGATCKGVTTIQVVPRLPGGYNYTGGATFTGGLQLYRWCHVYRGATVEVVPRVPGGNCRGGATCTGR